MRSAIAVELLVRTAVAQAMRTSLADWPADRPLSDVPDGIYDSLTKLDAISRLEHALKSGPLSAGDHTGDLDTIARITAWVVREVGGEE